uniref:PLAT domain-containing protein n=1 Tax=Zosterops lateralis melanops TaxID=1220523 RepID=A0A8D2QU81_ZOSLA
MRAPSLGIFLVTLYTGSRCNAGTKGEVFLQLIGQRGRSKFRCLWHQPSPAFQRGSIDCFLITTTKNLGDIHSFRIRLSNESKPPTWFLSRWETYLKLADVRGTKQYQPLEADKNKHSASLPEKSKN